MGWGGWAENEKKLEKKLSLFLGPPAGVFSRRQNVNRRVRVPLLPRGHFLPRLGGGRSIAAGPNESP